MLNPIPLTIDVFRTIKGVYYEDKYGEKLIYACFDISDDIRVFLNKYPSNDFDKRTLYLNIWDCDGGVTLKLDHIKYLHELMSLCVLLTGKQLEFNQ
jgi:hypothetical protein